MTRRAEPGQYDRPPPQPEHRARSPTRRGRREPPPAGPPGPSERRCREAPRIAPLPGGGAPRAVRAECGREHSGAAAAREDRRRAAPKTAWSPLITTVSHCMTLSYGDMSDADSAKPGRQAEACHRGEVGSSGKAAPAARSSPAAVLARSSQVNAAPGSSRTAMSSEARNGPAAGRRSPAAVT